MEISLTAGSAKSTRRQMIVRAAKCAAALALSPALAPLFYCFPGAGDLIYDNSGNPTGLGNALISPFALPAHLNSTSIRVDHTFSRKFAAFFRFGDVPSRWLMVPLCGELASTRNFPFADVAWQSG